jgi:hypothetical protein
MKDLYDLITNHPSLEQILIVLLLPLLGWSLGKIYDRYKGDNIFSNKRLVFRLLGCSLIGLICITFHWHIIAWLVFSTLIVLSAFYLYHMNTLSLDLERPTSEVCGW